MSEEPTSGATRGARLNGDGAGHDDWDQHWDSYGTVAMRNPANVYRHRMIHKLLGQPRKASTLLDIGSGQGEFAISYQLSRPDLDVWGVEHSSVGLERARHNAAEANVGVRFIQRDLLRAVERDPGQPAAAYATCSEVLEHVEEPTVLMRNAISLLAPGAKVVVTVPGGPRSAFDRHIGHVRHFTAPLLHQVLTEAGLQVDRVLRTGFPFFNLYKLAVIARGEKLAEQSRNQDSRLQPSKVEAAASAFFRGAFRLNLDDFPLGWQLAAVAHVPATDS